MAELNDFLAEIKKNSIEVRLEVILPGKLTSTGERIKLAYQQYVPLEFTRSVLETGIALDLTIEQMSESIVNRVQDEVESAQRNRSQ